jgi:hypothetical protein
MTVVTAGAVACAVSGALAGSAAAATGRDAASAQLAAATTAYQAAARAAGVTPSFGPNVYVFSPSMPQSVIQATVDAIATLQVPNQFGSQRFELLFEPGTYGSASDPLTFQVGYYTEVAGLGSSPGDTVINGSIDVYNQCDSSGSCIALNNFWRSLSNLTVNVDGGTGCQAATDFWAVSQASPMRRVLMNGKVSLMDYCNGGPDFASGGFIADSAFTGSTVVNGSQQQFFVRNSNLHGWTNGVWNQVFSGDIGAPAQAFGVAGGAGPYTTPATSPITEEEPFLQVNAAGSYSVFVPAVQTNSSGTSWQNAPAPGTALPIGRFLIADPSTPVKTINGALALGLNLILTPGVYDLSSPIVVSRPNTIVLGMGFPTLVPQNGTAAMTVLAGRGVKLSGLIFDAGPVNSPALLQLGTPLSGRAGTASDPSLVQDVFFRIGGAEAGLATDSLVVDDSDVILDDIWAWRADHGAGVSWTANAAATGVVVNGDDVIAYGLAVEHYQQSQTVWNGENGEVIFFQSEMPYDPPSQSAWMQGPNLDGYPSFEVAPTVQSFTGYGMGSYSNFDLGIPIEASAAFEAPYVPGVQFNDLLTVFLNNSGGIQSVINGVGAPVDQANPGPTDVTSYPALPGS